MILFKKVSDLRKRLESQPQNGKTIGFVPTMGALHMGHLSLVAASKKQDAVTVVSIFVNPTQFNDPTDFAKYPVTIERDIEALEAEGCDMLFLPSIAEVYPEGMNTNPEQSHFYDLGHLEQVFEGEYRPGHFQGVCRVVQRLTEIVQPNRIYLGQKDYQQCLVIKKLFTLPGQLPVTINIHPTMREQSGLAMSSRNERLSKADRETAAEIFRCLEYIRESIRPGDTGELMNSAKARLVEKGFKPEYISIADARDLSLITNWDGEQPAVILVAAWLKDVRLIDNMLLN